MTPVKFFGVSGFLMSQVAYLPAGKREQTKVQNRQAILDAGDIAHEDRLALC